ncbi:unnamed protein product [Symbiodinium natans]|uniref:Reticulocyte-binding protein 2-like a n=1 Tax=Symbiodinium natans TaxID=878477 RepID=A0A812TXI4_9DINO|nr:unnamed protein product [Symbiodinium natans]
MEPSASEKEKEEAEEERKRQEATAEEERKKQEAAAEEGRKKQEAAAAEERKKQEAAAEEERKKQEAAAEEERKKRQAAAAAEEKDRKRREAAAAAEAERKRREAAAAEAERKKQEAATREGKEDENESLRIEMAQLRELVRGMKEQQASDKRKIISLQEELKKATDSEGSTGEGKKKDKPIGPQDRSQFRVGGSEGAQELYAIFPYEGSDFQWKWVQATKAWLYYDVNQNLWIKDSEDEDGGTTFTSFEGVALVLVGQWRYRLRSVLTLRRRVVEPLQATVFAALSRFEPENISAQDAQAALREALGVDLAAFAFLRDPPGTGVLHAELHPEAIDHHHTCGGWLLAPADARPESMFYGFPGRPSRRHVPPGHAQAGHGARLGGAIRSSERAPLQLDCLLPAGHRLGSASSAPEPPGCPLRVDDAACERLACDHAQAFGCGILPPIQAAARQHRAGSLAPGASDLRLPRAHGARSGHSDL